MCSWIYFTLSAQTPCLTRCPSPSSLSKTSTKGYDIKDAGGADVGLIREENPWLKVLDSLLSEIPFLGMFINPAYIVELRGQPVLYLKKQPAVFEGKFTLHKTGEFGETEERLLIPSIIMMLMLERSRG
ncbi:MAG: hypothetical protein NZM11_04205 [Anaerolineales bacterium]|nr:hypothetical protein [Anaerolineales bacterium]